MGEGKVYLVGAGPGDPQLLTLKGLQAIQQADVIVYDRLVNPKLLEHASVSCEFIYCGKLPHCHTLKQEEINKLLVMKAAEGHTVVRLKGGDPSVFGRVGEEAELLASHNISFEIVPGITSGVAAPIYAGIPVTHREYGGTFSIATAHSKEEDGKPSLQWEGLAKSIDTIAFYMGVANLPVICKNLIQYGKSPTTPVALIQWGTLGRQKTVEGTLETIVEKAAAARIQNPAITLVGEIVSVRRKLNWFEQKPLFNRRILLVRTGTKESEIAKELMAQGADVVEFPKWKQVAAPIDLTILDKLPDYEHILFTSPESTADFFHVLREHMVDLREIKAELFGGSIKSVRALRALGFTAQTANEMPAEGKTLVVGDSHMEKTSIAHPQPDFFTVSRKEIDERFFSIYERIMGDAAFDTVIFPCGASVESFMNESPKQGIDPKQVLKQANVICMGETTKQRLAAYGISADDMPHTPTKEALMECLRSVPLAARGEESPQASPALAAVHS